ncbi:LacI family DNA-binding transcriptional regulator [Cetobacterium sp. 2G large]|uniref:LacI family DNA-binding transcriptional regulator n=1 Tax=Cetobacterium sp. 2G large TaxID=2759680 RepID=UPI00163C3F92|nr:LacI family DNA-binding transcriptional regulator [Cetobacterium sp. 2G large]MBC2854172.1 LacI family DNA-binding transcriptional regulator [Cetobacterium sp. 2G large]
MKKNKLTMKQIGDLLGVSQSTVSRVINNHPNIKKEVRDRVLKFIDENEFLPDYSAQILRGEKSKILGLLTVDFKNQYYLEIVNHVEKIARKQGYSIIVMNSERSHILEKKHIIELQKRGVDGIVACPVYKDNMSFIKKLGIPFVVVNEILKDYDSFSTSLFKGGEIAADFLINKGHCNVGYIGEYPSLKFDGFKSRYISNIDECNFFANLDSNFIDDLESFIKNKGVQCSAYFLSSDFMALHFLKILKKLKIDYSNIEFIGFDNTLLSEALNISSIEQPMEKMIELSLNTLTKKINGACKDENKVLNIELDPTLLIRN